MLSILSGLYPPTRGTAFVEGACVTDDLSRAREHMGICPQHDVLFDDLTVLEHLIMFANIKGASGDVRQEAEAMLLSVGLFDKKDEFTKRLSGKED